MPYYAFPQTYDTEEQRRSVAFCVANKINPKAPVFGSTFQLTEDGLLITREFEFGGDSGKAKILHDGCCGSSHFAKTKGRYTMLEPPEDYGFSAMTDSDGNVAD